MKTFKELGEKLFKEHKLWEKYEKKRKRKVVRNVVLSGLMFLMVGIISIYGYFWSTKNIFNTVVINSLEKVEVEDSDVNESLFEVEDVYANAVWEVISETRFFAFEDVETNNF